MRRRAAASWPIAVLALVAGCGAKSGLASGERGSNGEKGDDGSVPDCSNPDRDHDGHPMIECGGDDCDDRRGDVHPGAIEESEWLVEDVVTCRDGLPWSECPLLIDLALDADSGPVVAYVLPPAFGRDDPAWIATRSGEAWWAEQTPFRALAGIEVRDGVVYVVPSAEGLGVVAAWQAERSGEWVIEELDGERRLYCGDDPRDACGDLAWSPDGTLHAVFLCARGEEEVEVCHAQRDPSGDWTIATIGTAPGPATDNLDVTATDGIVRACAGTTDWFVGGDRYFELGPSGWSLRDVEFCQQLAVDPTGTVHVVGSMGGHVAFHGIDPGPAMELERLDGIILSGAGIDAGGTLFSVGSALPIPIDRGDPLMEPSDGLPLSLALRENGKWRFDQIDEAYGERVNELQLAGDSDGVHIAYRARTGDEAALGIRYATRTPARGVDNDCDGGER